MSNEKRQRRWYHPTPDRFIVGLLAVQVLLFLSERFQWFWFNEQKGWTVLIAVGVVGLAVLAMLFWGLVSLCLRRRFQFSFRSLLVFLVVVSVPLGWFAWEMQRAKRQREALEAIIVIGQLSGCYQIDELVNRKEGESATPTWLRKLFGDNFFCEVVSVNCDRTEFGDDDAVHLRKLTNLTNLSLNDTQITDNGVGYLKEVVTLERLSLAFTATTDNGLAHLKRLTKLRDLSFEFTQVTDNGLDHLKGMTTLEQLWLSGTQVTDEGIGELQQALPNCEIVH